MASPKNFVDLTGQRFGRLLVIRRASARKGRTFWLCQCDCGKTKEITASSLSQVNGTRSCGCLRRERVRSKLLIDLTGKKIGRLTVLGIDGYVGINNPAVTWTCQCDCGKKTTVRAQSLRKGDTRSCGCLRHERRINNIWKNRKKYPTTNRKAAIEQYICKRILDHCRRDQRGCELVLADIKALVFAPCNYCGQVGGRECQDYDKKQRRLISDVVVRYNGIDRIDSTKGYFRANVVTCCWDCNRAKGNLSKEQFYEWVRRIANHLLHV